MNAAARLVHQGTLTRQLVLIQLMTRQQMALLMLSLMILLSALSVIYVTHVTREMRAASEQNNLDYARLQMQRGQLLLERSTWMMQARVQQIAEKQLGMMMPDHKSVVIVHE